MDVLYQEGYATMKNSGELSNRTFNFGKASIIPLPDINNFQPHRITNIIDFDFNIHTSNAKLWVNHEGRIDFVDKLSNPTNFTNTSYDLIIQKDCADTTLVHVYDNAEFVVGDKIGAGNKGILSIMDSATLHLSNNGKLILREESEIHIYKGGVLSIDQDGWLTAESKCKIFVHNGGILRVNNKGVLNLTEDAEIIVEAHGRIIVNEGSIFKFEDGNLNNDGRCKITVKSLGNFDYRGAWKHEGNGYVQFDVQCTVLVDPNINFVARGFKKEIRFLRFNSNFRLAIDAQSINLGRGRIDYESNTLIDCKTTSLAILDSLTLLATINYAPTSNSAIGIKNYADGGQIIVNFSNFSGLKVGVALIHSDPDKIFFGPPSGVLLSIKRSVFGNVYKPVVVDGCYDVKMDSVYMMNGYKSEINGCHLADLKRVHVTNMTNIGFHVNNTEYFKVSNSTFTNCNAALYSEIETNIFAYQTSFVGNTYGIFTNGYDIYGLVELGCCSFYNNDYCVKGEDILFSISPLSGNNSGNFTVGNNKFVLANQNQKYFDVDYWVRNISVVEAGYNYWGGSFPDPSNYRIENNNNPVTLIYDPYHTVPVTCPQTGNPGNNSGCLMTPTGSTNTFTSIRENAMSLFHDGLTEQAELTMNQISDSQNDNYSTSSGPCQFHYDYARVFTKVPLQGGQPIVTTSNEVTFDKISIQPNPVNDQFTIRSEESINSVTIYNSMGIELFQFNSPDTKNYTVNSSNWQFGIYIAKVELVSGKISMIRGITKF